MGVNHNGWIDGSTTTSASCCHFNLKTLNTLTSLQQGGISSHFFFLIFQFRVTGALEPIPLGEVCGTPWACCQFITGLTKTDNQLFLTYWTVVGRKNGYPECRTIRTSSLSPY